MTEATKSYQEVAAKEINFQGNNLVYHGPGTNISQYNSPEMYVLGRATKNFPLVINVKPIQPTEINKIHFYFARLRAAVDMTITLVYKDSSKKDLDVRNNHRENLDIYLSEEHQDISEIIVKISKTEDPDELQQISKISLYGSKENNPFVSLANVILKHPRSLSAYYYYLFLFVLLGLTISSLFTEKLNSRFHRPHVGQIVSYLLAISSISVVGILIIVTGRTPLWYPLLLLFTVIVAFFSVTKKTYKTFIFPRNIYLPVVLFLLFMPFFYYLFSKEQFSRATLFDSYYDNTTTYSIPYDSFEQDFETPYGTSKVIRYRIAINSKNYSELLSINSITDRGVLFPFFAEPFFTILGDRFFIFEILGILLMSLVFPASYFLIDQLFGQRVATTTSYLLLINHFLLYVAHFSQIKFIDIAFLSLFYYFLISFKRTSHFEFLKAAGLAGTLAFLIHPFSIIYLFAGFLYLQWDLRQWWRSRHNFLKVFAFPSALILAWTIWGATINQHGLLYSVVVGPTSIRSSQLVGNPEVKNTSAITSLSNRWYNLLGLFVTDPNPAIGRSYGFTRLTIIAALLVSLFPFIVVSVYLRFKTLLPEILFLIVLTILLSIYPANNYYVLLGVVWYLVGLIPMLTGFGVSVLIRLPFLVYVAIIFITFAESIFVTWHIYHFDFADDLLRLRLVNPLGFVLVIIVFTIWYIFILKRLIHLRLEKNDLDIGLYE